MNTQSEETEMVRVKLLNGSQVLHEGTVTRMGDPNELSVIVEANGMTFEAWDLERIADSFITTSWKRLRAATK